MIDANQTLAEIATTRRESTQVFLKHQLDFCCGGQQRLSDACRLSGLDPAKVISEIDAEGAARSLERWDAKPLSELIDYIISHFHQPLRADLPALVEAARSVERVHAKKPSCPKGLSSFLEHVETKVNQHLAKEEQILFTAIRTGAGGEQVQMLIQMIMHEHEEHGANLQKLREQTGGFAAPPEACATWRALYAGLEKLERELMEHIHLENNVLFPRALPK